MSRPMTGQNVGDKVAQTGSKRSAEADLQRSQSKKHRRNDQSTKQEHIEPEEEAPKEESEPPSVKVRKPGQVRTPPPDAPTALTAKTHLIPPDAENLELRKDWEIDAIAITKNSTIKNAVVRTMAALMPSKSSSSSLNKKVLVALMARAESANTCISIVEIVKREIQSKQKSWSQYTGSWSRLETCPDKKAAPPQIRGGDIKVEAEEDDDDDDQFQTLQRSDRQRVRNIPCLVIYLSLEQVPVLRDLYGEQCNKVR